MLTREQLDHLCMLTALELPEEEKQLLLPQLSTLLDFVSQLDQCVLDNELGEETSANHAPTALANEGSRRDELLTNIRHHIDNHMPHLKTGLVK